MTVGKSIQPTAIVRIQCPGFFEDIFIGELHHIQSFQRGADTFKIASAVYQGVVQTGTAFFYVSGERGVSAKVTKITPNVRLAVEVFGGFP